MVEDEAVKLEFRSAKRYGNDAFVFRLANDPRRNLLVLSVRRITPSTFGPGEKELGVFCFAVLPPAPKSPRRRTHGHAAPAPPQGRLSCPPARPAAGRPQVRCASSPPRPS
ncbi:hypothetical protein [Oleiharenicola sp. Vm1]|uniref:hypothetical protein n=1 Tax=Oleiharenicola sp. Vm1 TaxID=3398393 RepID=UPI0039F62FC6